jgi:rRNA maturation endonuclease Nob1
MSYRVVGVERKTTKGFLRCGLKLSRREWWRLVRAAFDAGVTVESFIADAVRGRLDEVGATWVYPPISPHPKPGYVYAMASGGLCKLGRSVNPEIRSRASDVNAALLFKMPTSDMVWAEAYLHDVYEPWHVHGEWYRLSKAQIKGVLRLAPELAHPPKKVVP